MPISRADVAVGTIIIDTDYDYNLIHKVSPEGVEMYTIRGPNTGTHGVEEIAVILENVYYTRVVGRVPTADVEALVRIMKVVDLDWLALQLHMS